MPTTIITVMARIRSWLSSKRRKTSELVMGAIAAAATPSAARNAMSSPVVVTATTHRLRSPNTVRPPSSMRRPPDRSARDPAVSSRPPKVSEYAPTTHCSDVIALPSSRPMVGRAEPATDDPIHDLRVMATTLFDAMVHRPWLGAYPRTCWTAR